MPKESLDKFLDRELRELPRQPSREQLAKHVSKTLFQVAPSTTRRWPIKWSHVNGRAVCDAREGLIVAWRIANRDDRGRWPHYRGRLVEPEARAEARASPPLNP